MSQDFLVSLVNEMKSKSLILCVIIMVLLLFAQSAYALFTSVILNQNNNFSTKQHSIFFYYNFNSGIATQPENVNVTVTEGFNQNIRLDLGKLKKGNYLKTPISGVIEVYNKSTDSTLNVSMVDDSSPNNLLGISNLVSLESTQLTVSADGTVSIDLVVTVSALDDPGVYTGFISVIDSNTTYSFDFPIQLEVY
jgi:hypothetical protein